MIKSFYKNDNLASLKAAWLHDKWVDWFNSNKDIFDKLFSAAPPVMPDRPKNPFNKPEVTPPQPAPGPPTPQGQTQQKPPSQKQTTAKPAQPPKKQKKGFFKR